MTPRQNKLKLMDIGKSITDLAKELHERYPETTAKSLHTMISNMIYKRDYYPRYALYLNTKYGFKFEPLRKPSARQLLKAA